MVVHQSNLLYLKLESLKLSEKEITEADIEIAFPLVSFGGTGDGSDPKAKTAMLDLTHESWSPFNRCENWQVFIFCCSYGFAKKKIRKPPPGKGSMPPSAFKTETRDLMRAIAIAEENDLRIIKKASGKDGYVRICEEYAYSALQEVYNRIKTKDDAAADSHEIVIDNMIREIEDSRNNKN